MLFLCSKFRTSRARAVDDVGSEFLTKGWRTNCAPRIWKGRCTRKRRRDLAQLSKKFRFDSNIGCLNHNGRGASYDRFIASFFRDCKLYRLQSRLEYLIRNCSGDFFTSQTHRVRFSSVCRLQEIPVENRSPILLAVLFLLSSDDKLWSEQRIIFTSIVLISKNEFKWHQY